MNPTGFLFSFVNISISSLLSKLFFSPFNFNSSVNSLMLFFVQPFHFFPLANFSKSSIIFANLMFVVYPYLLNFTYLISFQIFNTHAKHLYVYISIAISNIPPAKTIFLCIVHSLYFS